MNILNKTKRFLREVVIELKRVNWPSKKETIKHTLTVIAVLVIVAVFLGGLDFLYTKLLNNLILK